MSFPDANPSPPAAAFMSPPFPGGGEVGGYWGQFPMNIEHPDANSSQHEIIAPPFKRPRNLDNNNNNHPLNSGLLLENQMMMNPQNLQAGGKGTSHIFYKTRMCAKFMQGTCRNGELCTFAHGMEDLREPPPNWQELVQKDRGTAGNWNDDQRLIQRMKICKRYYNGEECPYGEKCSFLHERPMKFMTDVGRQRESSAISIGVTGSNIMGTRGDSDHPDFKHINTIPSSSEAFRAKPVFWKTKMCTKWEITGQCPYGDRCHYAHGQSELHVHNSRVEAEAVAKSGPIQMKPLSIPLPDSAPAGVVPGAPNKEEEDEKKISKRKLTKKINRIYADWLDDFTPPHEVLRLTET